MAKIYIAIATYDKKVDVEILTKIILLPEYYPQHQFAVDFIASSIITGARNYLTKRFLAHPDHFDWLYFWDADLVIKDLDFLDKLLETSEKLNAGIVGGVYRIKSNKQTYAICNVVDGEFVNFKVGELAEPQLVDVVANGSMLIARKVLEAFDTPPFFFTEKKMDQTVPEDFNFCLAAKERGFLTAVDPRFATFHYGFNFWEHLPISKE